MAGVTREQIMQALFARLSGAPGQSSFVTTGRRLVDPENIAAQQRPALFVIAHGESYEREGTNIPPRRTMDALALIFTDVGHDKNAIPEAQLNNLLDAIDAAMVPDNPLSGELTLGGLVKSCVIEGGIERASGDITGKGMAVVPIHIVLP
jgi:hypothetical protein